MAAFDFSPENPLVRCYLFYTSILVLKMMLMSLLTGRQRFMRKAFVNPEDTVLHKIKPRTDDNVERVRRAHLNDLENIPIFFVASAAYLLTNPAVSTTIWLFRAFTIARIMHTLVYAVVVIPQPARALSFFVGFAVTGYMAVKTALFFL